MSYSDALKHIQQLIRSTEELAALGALARVKSANLVCAENLESALTQVMTIRDPLFFDDLRTEELTFLGATALGNLRRLTDLVEQPATAGQWNYTDPTVLEAQGQSSRAVTRFLTRHAQQDQDLFDILERGEPFLDVGSGVGWISISMAQQWPKLYVDGVEVFEPALQRAVQNRDQSGVADRVTFLHQSICDLDKESRYGAAFVPLMFLSEEVIRAALPRLRRAIRRGGMLFVAVYTLPDDPMIAALNTLQTAMSGGRVWTEDELKSLLADAGFTLEQNVSPGTPLNIYKAI